MNRRKFLSILPVPLVFKFPTTSVRRETSIIPTRDLSMEEMEDRYFRPACEVMHKEMLKNYYASLEVLGLL